MKPVPAESPFNLDNSAGYRAWREQKLAQHPDSLAELLVEIADPFNISRAETDTMMQLMKRCNMAIYQLTPQPEHASNKDFIYALGRHFGLQHFDHNLHADEDAVSSLTITAQKAGKGYIPYTNRPIAWHTDGYYNNADNQVRAMLLHCVQPAAEGGANLLLDHEIAYILLRDLEPRYIAALSRKDAMSIPANVEQGKTIREAVSGPVFSLDPAGHLHMRYTARARSIQWLNDPLVLEARDALQNILKTRSAYHLEGKLAAGQGLLCNNVLHTRSGFEADSSRLLYRARYFDRIFISN